MSCPCEPLGLDGLVCPDPATGYLLCDEAFSLTDLLYPNSRKGERTMSNTAPGVNAKQKDFFANLLERKQFPEGTDAAALTATFATLTRKTASEWIDRALALPNATDADDAGATTPAPF